MRIGVVSVAGDIFPPIRMKYLIEKGNDVYYLGILPSLNNPNFKINGFKYIAVGSRLLSTSWLLSMLDVALKMRRIAKKLRLDILHVIDMAFCICSLFSGARVTVLENNGSDVLVAPKECSYFPFLYKYCYRSADAIIQDSVVVQEAAYALGAKRENNEVIELGTDFSLFNLDVRKGVARARHGISPSQKIIFSPRGLIPICNLDVIVRSVAIVSERYSDIVCIFCGYGLEIEAKLRKLAIEVGVKKNVIFVGVLDRITELPYYYADADVVVSIPSSDSMSASVIEAMACGTPVIVSELPWYHHRFVRNVDLVTVPLRDHNALAKAIIGLFDGKPMIDRILVSKNIQSQSDYRISGERLESLYQRLLEGH